MPENADSPSLPENLKKLETAAKITNEAMKTVVAACVKGAIIFDICEMGDKYIMTEVEKVYQDAKGKNGKKILKGLCFPTTVSVNNVICHFSPSVKDATQVLEDGDLVKVELGTHIDGFPANLATSIVVGANSTAKAAGKKADVVLAAYEAVNEAMKLLKPGHYNTEVTDLVQKITKEKYHVLPVEGIIASELKPRVLDGDKRIIFNPSEAQLKEYKKTEFGKDELYSLDIVVSSSATAKAHPSSLKCNIFKRNEVMYELKMQSSRKLLSEATQKFGYMPFNIRHLSDEKKARMGLIECLKHGLYMPYEILEEKKGEVVAQFLYTILITAEGEVKQLTQVPFDPSTCSSEYTLKQ